MSEELDLGLGDDQYVVVNQSEEPVAIVVAGKEVVLQPGVSTSLDRENMTPEELRDLPATIKVEKDWIHIDLDSTEEESGLMLGEKEMYYPEMEQYSLFDNLADQLNKEKKEE